MSSIKPEDFASDAPPERIIGVECEYNIQNRDAAGTPIALDKYISSAAVASAGLIKNGNFLSDGGKLYVDVCSMLEYATPESLGPAEAALQDHAGVQKMQNIVNGSGMPHQGMYRLAGTYLSQAVSHGTSSGYHPNFLLPRYLVEGSRLVDDVMSSHLASKLWSMNGTVRLSGYAFGQKVWGIGAPVVRGFGSRTTHGNKPMAGILENDNDTVGGVENWVRLEIRMADPSGSRAMTELDFASTSLTARLLEHVHRFGKRRLTEMILIDPVGSAKRFAGDVSLSAVSETIEGKSVSAANIQESLATLALELSEKIALPADEKAAASRWLETAQMLRVISPELGHYTKASRMRMDIAARHMHLLKGREIGDITSANKDVMQHNLVWDRVLPEGLGQIYWRKLAALLGDTATTRNYPEVPATRAAIRAEVINNRKKPLTYVNWAQIKWEEQETIKLHDPYQTEL